MIRRGQGIMEYMIILTAIVAAIIIGARTFIRNGTRQAMHQAEQTVDEVTKGVLSYSGYD